MKKQLVYFIVGLFALQLQAQDYTDAIRHGSEELQGTARFKAMSGAFGALGGDLSAINMNPAGSSVFLNSHAAVSLAVLNNEINSNFGGTNTIGEEGSLTINQAGVVFVFDNFNEASDWNKFALAINYNQTKEYDQTTRIEGSSSNSIDQYFLGFAQGTPLSLLQLQGSETISDLYQFLGENEGFGTQQAFLAYQSFLIDANDNNDLNNTAYFSNIGTGTVDQEYNVVETGYNGKLNANFSTQYKKDWHFGLSVNSHVIDTERYTNYLETNNNGGLVDAVRYENRLRTEGTGLSFQLGIIKAIDKLRLGVSYQSPTWYSILEEGTQAITTRRGDGSGGTINEQIVPNVINLYPEYDLRTPGNLTTSIAYIFGPQGLLSADVTFKDYSTYQFSPKNNTQFSNENQFISNNFNSSAIDYRIGAEYRLDQLSLRGGLRHEDSQFNDETLGGDLNGYSLGLGYNFGSTKLDLAYDHSERDGNTSFFGNTSSFDRINDTFTLTLSFEL